MKFYHKLRDLIRGYSILSFSYKHTWKFVDIFFFFFWSLDSKRQGGKRSKRTFWEARESRAFANDTCGPPWHRYDALIFWCSCHHQPSTSFPSFIKRWGCSICHNQIKVAASIQVSSTTNTILRERRNVL